jgi:hypothetical protein
LLPNGVSSPSVAQTVLDGIRVAGFMKEAHEIDGVTFDLIADVLRKRATILAGKAVRTDVIPPFPTDHSPDCVIYPLAKVAAEPC